MKTYEDLYTQALRDGPAFWSQAAEAIHWDRPFTRALDESRVVLVPASNLAGELQVVRCAVLVHHIRADEAHAALDGGGLGNDDFLDAELRRVAAQQEQGTATVVQLVTFGAAVRI